MSDETITELRDQIERTVWLMQAEAGVLLPDGWRRSKASVDFSAGDQFGQPYGAHVWRESAGCWRWMAWVREGERETEQRDSATYALTAMESASAWLLLRGAEVRRNNPSHPCNNGPGYAAGATTEDA